MMTLPTDYSLRYSSTAGIIGNIVLPGGTSELSADGSGVIHKLGNGSVHGDEGVVIMPQPAIVIKTRLLRESSPFELESERHSSASLLFEDMTKGENFAGASNPYMNRDATLTAEKNETKVFINICTHPFISMPAKRKGIDEDTGSEVDGWRLPMSMGELRPFYCRSGSVAVVTDCILNPKIVEEMIKSSTQFHFVCDLVIQCAIRKFKCTWFKGGELDMRYKLPRMKYAGYVDKTTGLPIVCGKDKSSSNQSASVVMQRVKGNGGKSIIIEEHDDSTSTCMQSHEQCPVSSKCSKQIAALERDSSHSTPSRQRQSPKVCIELFIGSDAHDCKPMFEFLSFTADKKTFGKIQKLTNSVNDEAEYLHMSQLLKVPIPFRIDQLSSFTESPYNGNSGKVSNSTSTIVARSTIDSQTCPRVDLSASYLIITCQNHSKTECVLPFTVDPYKANSTYNHKTKLLEIIMPILMDANLADKGPDPGTRQWELSNIVSQKYRNDSRKNKDNDLHENKTMKTTPSNEYSTQRSKFIYHIDEEEFVESEQLPEDSFHSQDILSCHLLQQQEIERNKRATTDKTKNDEEEDDVEYINVNDFRPGGKYFSSSMATYKPVPECDKENSILMNAQIVLKEQLQHSGILIGGDIALTLA